MSKVRIRAGIKKLKSLAESRIQGTSVTNAIRSQWNRRPASTRTSAKRAPRSKPVKFGPIS